MCAIFNVIRYENRGVINTVWFEMKSHYMFNLCYEYELACLKHVACMLTMECIRYNVRYKSV